MTLKTGDLCTPGTRSHALPQPAVLLPQLSQWLEQWRKAGGFLLIVGDSSVGKTRLAYECVLEILHDWAVLVPDLGEGELVNTVADSTFKLPNLIVWLDELQRFLPGPYLTEGSTALNQGRCVGYSMHPPRSSSSQPCGPSTPRSCAATSPAETVGTPW